MRCRRGWPDDVNDEAARTISAQVKSYFYGDNVEGKRYGFLAYVGSLPELMQRLHAEAAGGYPSFVVTPDDPTRTHSC